MATPISSHLAFALGAICLSSAAGCVSPKSGAPLEDLSPAKTTAPTEKSLYEMAVSNEAKRLRKENPELSPKEAVEAARKNVRFETYDHIESPSEKKARKLREAQQEFGEDFEKAMRQ